MPLNTVQERREYQRRYYQAHKEKAKEYQREYNRTHHKNRSRKKSRGEEQNRSSRESYNLQKLACVVAEKFPAAFDRYISSVLGCK